MTLLLESLNIYEDRKRNVLANIKMENSTTNYEDIKTAVRLLKGSIVEGNKKKSDEDINFSDKRRDKWSKSHSRSKGRQRHPS